jgi:hypothetical protein
MTVMVITLFMFLIQLFGEAYPESLIDEVCITYNHAL